DGLRGRRPVFVVHDVGRTAGEGRRDGRQAVTDITDARADERADGAAGVEVIDEVGEQGVGLHVAARERQVAHRARVIEHVAQFAFHAEAAGRLVAQSELRNDVAFALDLPGA